MRNRGSFCTSNPTKVSKIDGPTTKFSACRRSARDEVFLVGSVGRWNFMDKFGNRLGVAVGEAYEGACLVAGDGKDVERSSGRVMLICAFTLVDLTRSAASS